MGRVEVSFVTKVEFLALTRAFLAVLLPLLSICLLVRCLLHLWSTPPSTSVLNRNYIYSSYSTYYLFFNVAGHMRFFGAISSLCSVEANTVSFPLYVD